MKRVFSGAMVMILLASMLYFALTIFPVIAQGEIYIRADGSIDPPTAPISTLDNVTYTLVDNIINDTIVVERSTIVIDGAGYTLQGTGAGYGIRLMTVTNVTVRNAQIENFQIGIWLYSSSSNSISGNDITANTEDGIRLFSSSSNTISGNNITNNNQCGIVLEWSSNYNTVIGNNITANNYGIDFYSSSSNTISGNNIANSNYGIFLAYCADNGFYHNNFINNSQQIFSYNSTNVWDDGYPSGGNYWTDYSGTDSFSGVYQTVIGIDGMGDTPYIIDVNNSDTYPFMGPLVRAATGLNVTVYAEPDVGLAFANLTWTGLVSSYKREALPVWMPSLPSLVGKYIDVTVTVVSYGKITVAVSYDDTNMTQEEEEGLQLSQWKGCDVTGPTQSVLDGIINMRDIALFADKFMILGGSEQWEPRCDVTGPTPEVPDGKVDMRDVAKACLHFTGTNSWVPITTYIDTVNNIIYGETTHFSIFGVH